jgi:hypothetical protein
MIDEIINKPKYQLVDWKLNDIGTSYCLMGKLIGKREGFYEGEVLLTSRIIRIDFETKLAETKNSFYELID